MNIQFNKKREEEIDSQFKDYQNNEEEERTEHINKELNKLPIHKNLQKQNLKDVMMDFDSTSFHLSAMWDEKHVYPKIETGFAFKAHMNDVYEEALSNQSYNQDGDESAILRIKYYIHLYLSFNSYRLKKRFKK